MRIIDPIIALIALLSSFRKELGKRLTSTTWNVIALFITVVIVILTAQAFIVLAIRLLSNLI